MNIRVIEMTIEQAELLFEGEKWMHFCLGESGYAPTCIIVDSEHRLLGVAEGSTVERDEYGLADPDFYANAACLHVSLVRKLLADPSVSLLRLRHAVDLREDDQ